MERLLLTVVLCIIWTPVAFGDGHKWSYDKDAADGPSKWGGVCQTGKKQSPIDIPIHAAIYDKGMGAFTLKNYDMKPAGKFTAKNNGHSLVVSFPENVYNVSGGGLNGVYTTVQVHLHWGSVNMQGSEHFLNGKKYAAELHFVSYNTKYADLTTAVAESDGLAVLGMFMMVEGEDNAAFSFLDYAKNLTKAGTNITINPFMFKTMLPNDLTKYFRYSGSLTTPDCQESVTWTVFNNAVNISQAQMDILRALKNDNDKSMSNNFRPIQALEGRTVKSSFEVLTEPQTTKAATTTKPTTTSPTADASTISMTAGLFSLMLFSALFVR